MHTVNKRVACTPFETTQVRMEASRGMPNMRQRRELTKLTVLLPGEGYQPGDVIWVRGDSMKHQYAAEVYEQDTLSFILVPTDHIMATERPQPRSNSTVSSVDLFEMPPT
jgi:hypothetical protein